MSKSRRLHEVRLHEVMAGYVERGYLPGLATLVARGDRVHADAIGTTAMDGQDPMRRDTIFRIASMSKPVIALAAMILVEECKLRLDDPVDDLLPELADRRVLKSLDSPVDDTVPAERPITLRDLLTFTWGIGLILAMPGTYPIQAVMDETLGPPGPPSPQGAPAPDEWMRRLGTLPLLHQPGHQWMYNTGSDVLGVLIARASGQPLDVFLAERVFEPLGMTDTGFYVPAEKLSRLATSYAIDQATGSLVLYDPPNGQWATPPAFPSGGGGLVSTLDDMHAFGRLFLDGGKSRVVSRAAIELITSDQLSPAQKAATPALVPGYFDNHGWGFGGATVLRRTTVGMSTGSYGWDGGLGTSWYVDPAANVITVLLTQRGWNNPGAPALHQDFWTCAYQDLDD